MSGKVRLGINATRYQDEKMWSFGACISRWGEEIYLYINIFKWSIAIGRIYKYKEDKEDEGGSICRKEKE